MINPYKIRRNAAIIFVCIIVSVFYRLGLVYGFMGSLVGLGLGTFFSVFIAGFLLNNPYREVMEGQGVLALDINSTGVMQPFLVKVMPPKMGANYKGKFRSGHYDRKISFSFKNLKKGIMSIGQKPEEFEETEGRNVVTTDDKIYIVLSKKEANDNRFVLDGRPTFIFNSMLDNFVDKDFFSQNEKKAIAQHSALFELNDKTNGLVSAMRDFARHSINQLGVRSFGEIFKSKMFIIIMIIILGLLALLFFPQIMETINGLQVG